MKKIYLAGPDVFRENALKHFDNVKKLCLKYGFEGLSPFDNNSFDGELFSKEHSKYCFLGNVDLINKCDIVLLNLDLFRGACIDDGTAFEAGCGYAKGKLLYGYTPFSNITHVESTVLMTERCNIYIKYSTFPIIESFVGNSVNLMLQESIELSGGKILRGLEDCLIDISNNLE